MIVDRQSFSFRRQRHGLLSLLFLLIGYVTEGRSFGWRTFTLCFLIDVDGTIQCHSYQVNSFDPFVQ